MNRTRNQRRRDRAVRLVFTAFLVIVALAALTAAAALCTGLEQYEADRAPAITGTASTVDFLPEDFNEAAFAEAMGRYSAEEGYVLPLD